ncbi:hypothetical protein BDF21DRAFT_451443 [Thamnidium elegans]|nr:hypothetical protein BDF21DRAFT_451443 [Thamnidium elegans]
MVIGTLKKQCWIELGKCSIGTSSLPAITLEFFWCQILPFTGIKKKVSKTSIIFIVHRLQNEKYLVNSAYFRGEKASFSSGKRKNKDRSIIVIDSLVSKKTGSKCDTIFRDIEVVGFITTFWIVTCPCKSWLSYSIHNKTGKSLFRSH